MRWKPFLPALLWAVIIFILSTGASVQLPEITFSPDKIGHFCAYGLLHWLVMTGLRKSGKWNLRNTILVMVAVALYGTALEFVQWAFFPDRFFEFWDMIANITGVISSQFLFSLVFKKTN